MDSQLFHFVGMVICYGIGIAFALLTIAVTMIFPIRLAYQLTHWIALKQVTKIFGSEEEFRNLRKSYQDTYIWATKVTVNYKLKESDLLGFIKLFVKKYNNESKDN